MEDREMTQMTHAYDWRGRGVGGSDGEEIGKLHEGYLDTDSELSTEEESALYSHYGREYSAPAVDETETVGHDTSGPTTDDAMTRSEEELHVGTAQRERGRARLRKYIVTEQVQQTVPVQREEVRIEREPITEGNVDQALDGPAISEEEHEVVLHEEEVVTEKRTVPKERVRMEKDTVVEEETVATDVRKEQIEVEGDGTSGAAR